MVKFVNLVLMKPSHRRPLADCRSLARTQPTSTKTSPWKSRLWRRLSGRSSKRSIRKSFRASPSSMTTLEGYADKQRHRWWRLTPSIPRLPLRRTSTRPLCRRRRRRQPTPVPDRRRPLRSRLSPADRRTVKNRRQPSSASRPANRTLPLAPCHCKASERV